MARLILKWRYIKPGTKQHNSNLVKYIAKRHGVDKIDDTWKFAEVTAAQQDLITQILKDFPETKDSHEYQDFLQAPTCGKASEFISSTIEENLDRIDKRDNYVRYIAHRPGAEQFGTHGLFTYDNVAINLESVAQEAAEHDGILMTQILSLRREDAARLGYESGEAWRDLIRGHAADMAKAMNIPLADLKWYAAFHNESHHPHCHIVAYSVGKEPYMSQKDLEKLKSSFAREIFKQDLLQIYEEQTLYRNSLSEESRARMQKIIADIQLGDFENAVLLTMIQELSRQLKAAKGKKVYGYLPQPTRDLVNNIVDELAKDPRLAELYELWYTQRDKIIRTYHDRMEDRLPLSQNKTFQSIRNIVVSEVLSLPEDIGDISFRKNIPEHILEHSVELDESIDSDIPKAVHIPQDVDLEKKLLASSAEHEDVYAQRVLVNYGSLPVSRAYFRLLSAIAQMMRDDLEKEQTQKMKIQVDKKQRQKIAEKKQAQGLRLG